jgi:ABC-type transport system involved in multi-copper enzyme maturation permease subunit
MGTAYWMFPKKLDDPRRGPNWAGWTVFILFNTGLIFLVISTLFRSLIYAAAFGRGLLLFSILVFAVLMWQRIVTYRNHH